MEEGMKVEIQYKKLVSPSFPTPHHLHILKISSIDQLLHAAYVTPIFFYHLPYLKTPHESLIKQLERSLSQTLTLFYPLAGRYIKHKGIIDCNDRGVEFLVAKASGVQLSKLVNGSDKIETSFLNQLITTPTNTSLEDIEAESSPLLYVQVNLLDCGNIAIALSISQKIPDGFTASKFVNTWSSISCTEQNINNLERPKFLLGSVFPRRECDDIVSEEMKGEVGRKESSKRVRDIRTSIGSRRRLVFGEEWIRGVKEKVGGGRRVSRVVVVTALLWGAFNRINQTKRGGGIGGEVRDSMVVHVVNMRGRTLHQVPDLRPQVEDSCGSFFRPVIARHVPKKGRTNADFMELLSVLDDALKETIEKMAQMGPEDLYLSTAIAWKELGHEVQRGEADINMFSSWARLDLYEANFGWGEPTWVCRTHIPGKLVMLMDTRDGNGIEALVGLEETDMNLFLHDPDIMAFSSTNN